MRVLIMFLATIAAMPIAYADQQADAIAQQATKCWNVNTRLPKGQKILMSIELDQRGEVEDVTYLGEEPTSGYVYATIQSLGRAIQRCAPYADIREGVHEVKFDSWLAKGGNTPIKN